MTPNNERDVFVQFFIKLWENYKIVLANQSQNVVRVVWFANISYV
jgi:hypothetical protein